MNRIKAFFRRIFLALGLIKKDKIKGRMVVKNLLTGKHEFVGVDLAPTSIEELEKINDKVEKLFVDPREYVGAPMEPLRANRFVVEFDEFEEYVVSSFSKDSLAKEARVDMIIPISTNTFDRLFELNHKLQSSKAKEPSVKVEKDAVIKLLDPTGAMIRKVTLHNPEVIKVGLLERLDYGASGDEILKGSVTFKYKTESKN
jgi:hypothetical protein